MSTTACIFYHPKDREEHDAMFGTLDYARRVGDANLIIVYLKCLTACSCGWKPTPKEEARVETTI